MEFLGGWNKEEDDEEGDGFILGVFFFLEKLLVWVCALVLYLCLLFWFGFGLCCACDIEEDGRKKS